MKTRDVDQMLSAANPVEWAELPPPDEAEREFLENVVALPQEPAGRPRRRGGSEARGIWARYLGGAVAICAGALALLLVPSSGRGPAPVSPEPAYAAELARIAKGDSPAIVIEPSRRKGSRPFVVDSRAFVVEPKQRANGTSYVIKPVEEDGWTEVDPAVVWDCTDLPCNRKTNSPKEAKELFRAMQKAGN